MNDDVPNAVKTIEEVLSSAEKSHASDIHFDPNRSHILVRFRIDGCMKDVQKIDLSIIDELVARLKVLSGARTDLHLIPQDGRFKTTINGRDFNVRVSFMPTYHGENAVLRLLPADVKNFELSKLGFTPNHVRSIHSAMNRTHGLILVTGPTGSGKTTTLHSCLKEKSKLPLSIITLEDPVEYELEGIRQVHINHSYGVNFAGGLRSALRQDPDVIMIGEIRDSETAKVAIHTALTGHLVLSTLHTNSAIEAIPRLIDMGIDHYLLAATLRLIIAQRLVRNVCQACLGDGCETCKGAGYSGRSVIAEVLEASGLSKSIESKCSIEQLNEESAKKGFIPILNDGNEKVDWGITTREEVMRVLYS